MKRNLTVRCLLNIFLVILGSLSFLNITQAQLTSKIVAECTITYSVSVEGNNNGQTIKKLFIKGKKTRSEISNASFFQATIFDNKDENAVVIKEIGTDKYISFFTPAEWKEKNNLWEGSVTTITNETKKILTFNCRKAIIKTKSGSSYNFYYTTDILASATENPYQFNKINGLILEYETEGKEGKSIECKATDISFIPVPAAKFTIPTPGYRVIK